MKKILVTDDDPDFRSYLVQILTDAGYETEVASCCGEALTKAAATPFDLILLDMMMPRGNGADCLPELRRSNPRTAVIVITAFSSIRNAVDLVRKGASDYLAKPFKIDELLVTVKRTLEEASFEKRAETREFHVVLGALSSPIRSEIVRLLDLRKQARLTDIAQDLHTDDRAKILFHLKKLEQSGIVEREGENGYSLTLFGGIARECLKILETHLSTVVA